MTIVSSDDYSFRCTGVILSAYFKSISYMMLRVFNMFYIGVKVMPKRDIESQGVMGKGAGGGQEILPPPPPPSSSPTESGCLRITKSFVF